MQNRDRVGSTKCSLCESGNIYLQMHHCGYALLRCAGCGLIFVDIDSVDSAQLYAKEYFQGEVYQDYIGDKDKRLKGFEDNLALIDQYLPNRGSLLEIGSAAGFFLKVAQDGGWKVKGIEVSKYAAEFGREELGVDICCTDIDSMSLEEETYDAAVLWDVIEHLKNPFRTLEHLHVSLKKDGYLFLTTGNISGLNFAIYGKKWYLLAPPHHLWYFSHKNMTNYLKKIGFDVVSCTSDGNLFDNNDDTHSTIRRLFSHWRVKKILGSLNVGNAFNVVARKKRNG